MFGTCGKTPRELGYRMPGEWEKRRRTFMQWPVRVSERIW